jgi:hypothetical protein
MPAMNLLPGSRHRTVLRRSHLRSGRGQRLALEWLEDRTLFSISPLSVDTYPYTVTPVQGSGELTAEVVPTLAGTAGIYRLTLSGPGGQTLIQSDSGRIVEYLLPGAYSLSVSSPSGPGSYRLTTSFTQASGLLVPLATGTSPKSVAVGDLTGNGILDVVAPNFLDNTLSVFLGNGDGTFRPPEVIPCGAFPVSVTVADVNRDGKLDLLVANKRNASVSVLLGNGDGTFQPEKQFAVGQRPSGVAVADLDGDGKPDLVVSNYRSGTVSVLLGNGDGTFQPQKVYNVGSGPGKVEVADLNGDGIPDIVTPNYSGADISVLLGNGDGAFRPQLTFATGRGPYEVAIADFNGDGRPDLAVSNYADNTVSVLLGNPLAGAAGSSPDLFLPRQTVATGFEPYAVVAADVNGDGKADLVTSNWGDNSVSVLLGDGDGTFQPEKAFPVGKNPHVVAVADLNGDGKLDIVTPNTSDDTISVLLGNGDGTFQSQQAAPSPAPGTRPFAVAVADLNGDGRPDIVTANRGADSVSVLLSNSDGTFGTRETFPAGSTPKSIAVGDFNGDGIPDLVTANYDTGTVSVLLGNGDGTFGPPRSYPAGNTTYAVAVADVDGDGNLDIIAANKGDGTVSVLLGKGDGTFQPQQVYPAGPGVDAVTVADLTGNGEPDIVTGNFGADTVNVLLNNGDGTFAPAESYAAGANPSAVAVADLAGDGKPDIIVADYSGNCVDVLPGNGDGTFGTAQSYAAGTNPDGVKVADLSGDGKLDIVTANYGAGNVSVLTGNGDGTFQPPRSFAAGSGASALAIADFNRDGRPDLVVSNRDVNTVSLLVGNGDGTFQPQQAYGLTENRYSLAVADVNGDGKPDLVTTSLRNDTVSVQLGNGTGAFARGQTLPVGEAPTSAAVADLNGDGRLDVVTTNSGDGTVSVLLGNGDGTFQAAQTFAVGRGPRQVVAAKLTGDGIPDLVVTNYDDNTVCVLLGKGDGTFAPQEVYAVGQRPYGVAVADVNSNGVPDIVVANAAGDDVSVLIGNGNGTFAPQKVYPVGRQPFSVAVADLAGNGILDIITGNFADSTVSVLAGRGSGAFAVQQVYAVGKQPSSVAAAEVNGDGKLDLVTADYGDGAVSVLLDDGSGSFLPARALAGDALPVQTVVADVNGDGRPDLVSVGNHDATTGVLLNNGDGAFQPATAATDVELRDTPLLADLTGDGIADSVVLDRSGNILFRKGLGGATDAFAPPVILNPGRPARDITLVHTGSGVAIAAADAHFDPELSASGFVFTVSLYTVSPGGSVNRVTAFSTTALPVRIAAADQEGRIANPSHPGLDDLIVANSLDNSVTIALQTSPGTFAAPFTVPAGVAPSDIAVANVNGDGMPDVIVSNQASGDVSVLLNDPSHAFGQTLRFRSGTEINGMSLAWGGPVLSSLAQSVALAAGDFTGSGLTDLVVVNAGVHSFSVLKGDGSGFSDPETPLTFSTSDGLAVNEQPGAVVAGDFDRDGKPDLAVLMQDTGEVWIYTKTGGAFTHTFSVPVGEEATGLSVVPGSGPGLLDLLVGNGFGDVLHLQGKGDGTFQIAGKRVSLSVVPDLLGPGQAGVLVGNQANNEVTVQAPTAGGAGYSPVESLSAGIPSGQLAPGDVHWFVLDGNEALPDAVVVSSGSNAVIVYHTTGVIDGAPTFAPSPQTYFVGTAPASVSAVDINGDGIPDLIIANRDSNDVSVIFGARDAHGNWYGLPGPRLKAGGDGPVAAMVRVLGGSSQPDLVVINGDSGTVTALSGVGQGFFDDRSPRKLFDLGGALVGLPTFVGNTGVGYAVMAGGALVRFDLNDPSGGASVVYTGQGVLAARALDSGQVVVALSSGAVRVLIPQGIGLTLSAELEARAGVPVVPSAIDVIQTESGQLQVLVSSQGSDTIFVYGQAGGSKGGSGDVSASGSSVSGLSGASVSFLLTTANGSNAAGFGATLGAGLSGSPGVGLGLSTLGSTVVLSLGGTLSHDSGAATTGSVVLAPVQGNVYTLAAMLDFGGNDEGDAAVSKRNPALAVSLPIGDTSPLTRFVIGQDEAVRQYRGTLDGRLPEGAKETWNEDLFPRIQPLRPPMREKEEPRPMGAPHDGGAQNAPEEEALFARLANGDDPLSSLEHDRGESGTIEALAVLLVGMVLAERDTRSRDGAP